MQTTVIIDGKKSEKHFELKNEKLNVKRSRLCTHLIT